jgi:hypothetical protein
MPAAAAGRPPGARPRPGPVPSPPSRAGPTTAPGPAPSASRCPGPVCEGPEAGRAAPTPPALAGVGARPVGSTPPARVWAPTPAPAVARVVLAVRVPRSRARHGPRVPSPGGTGPVAAPVARVPTAPVPVAAPAARVPTAPVVRVPMVPAARVPTAPVPVEVRVATAPVVRVAMPGRGVVRVALVVWVARAAGAPARVPTPATRRGGRGPRRPRRRSGVGQGVGRGRQTGRAGGHTRWRGPRWASGRPRPERPRPEGPERPRLVWPADPARGAWVERPCVSSRRSCGPCAAEPTASRGIGRAPRNTRPRSRVVGSVGKVGLVPARLGRMRQSSDKPWCRHVRSSTICTQPVGGPVPRSRARHRRDHLLTPAPVSGRAACPR